MVDLGVIHGRFQVLHNDHLAYLLAGKARCRHLIVGITNPDPVHTRTESADPSRSDPLANPLTYYERLVMVRAVLTGAGVGLDEFTIVPFPIGSPELYETYLPAEATYFLTIYDSWGREKLGRFQRLGLKTEVLWEKNAEEKGIEASDVRRRLLQDEEWVSLVPNSTKELIEQWDITGRLRRLAEQTT